MGAEYVITIAGEGLDLSVAEDHNILMDYRQIVDQLEVNRDFTPVIGDEVATKEAHF